MRPIMKRLLVAAACVGLALFLRNPEDTETVSSLDYQADLDRIAYRQVTDKDVVTLDKDSPEYLMPADGQNPPAHAYRLSFSVQSSVPPVERKPGSPLTYEPTPSLDLSVLSKDGSSAGLATVSLPPSPAPSAHEVIVPGGSGIRDIAFRSADSDSTLRISDLRLTGLSVSSISEAAGLRPTVRGDTQRPVTGMNVGGYSFMAFDKSNERIGQYFVAQSDALSGIDLRLKLRGIGGKGPYHIQLRPAVQSGKSYSIGNDIIVGLDFAPYQLWKYALPKGSDNPDGDLYHFPLAAFLTPGEGYYIGISNQDVDFGFLHTLEIGVRNAPATDDPSDTGLVSYGSSIASSRQLYHVIYGATFQTVGTARLMSGATISDLGNGHGLYRYSLGLDPASALDLDPQATLSQRAAKNMVFYDTSRFALETSSKASLIYRIDTSLPFSSLFLQAEAMAEGQPLSLSYSYDGQAWVSPPVSADNAPTPHLSVPSNGSSLVWLRVASATADDASRLPLIGVKSLDITADLNMGR